MSRADWTLRSEEFGPLQARQSRHGELFVAMTMRSPGIDDPGLVERLWRLWVDLPIVQPCLFDPVGITDKLDLLVRYAALDWSYRPLRVDDAEAATKRVATWGIDLTRAFELLDLCVPADELGWFACPFMKIDLRGAPRVGFVSPAGGAHLMNRVAPEVVERWPICNQPGLVFAVGQLLLGAIMTTRRTLETPFGKVLMRCLERDPVRRFPTLTALRDALAIVGGDRNARYGGEDWPHLEMGVAYATLGMPTLALWRFESALKRVPGSEWATSGRDRMLAEGADPTEAAGHFIVKKMVARGTIVHVPPRHDAPAIHRWRKWDDVRATARALVDSGQFSKAIELYLSTETTRANEAEIFLAIAECHLGAREYGIALDYAQRVLDREPANLLAHELKAEARYKRREYEEASEACSEWMAVAPSDGRPHYLRAKILLALGWFAEARDACTRATELTPKHLPAMLLRLHLDRSIKRVRMAAGKAKPVPIDLPEHLRDLRELLVTGRNAEAIEILERPEYATDTQAQLLRADLLLFSDRLEDALAAFEKTGGLAGKLGQGTVLVRLRRFEDALALCDALVREHPTASEPHEARATALQALGRNAEAEDAYKRALAADTQRSNARVRLGRG